MDGFQIWELVAFVLYFTVVLGIGAFFFKKSGSGEKGYFLGDRQMGPYVTALSAQASDMSGWLLMGLPGSVLAAGFGKVWLAIGLAIGTYLNWLLIATRLRRFSKVAGDSITIPQYLNNRFKSTGKTLQVICAIVFCACFTIYVASGFKAAATLFSTILPISIELSLIIAVVIILAYTFMGGFSAVCWTDFFQGIMMLVAIIATPIIGLITIKGFSSIDVSANVNYFNLLPSGKFDYDSIAEIISGLAWGLGYFGMPHILVRFMAIKKSSMIKTSRRVAIVWVILALAAACLVGLVGRGIVPQLVDGASETVFIEMVRKLFPGFIAGILLSAILAASMSTADSQLLVASSSFTSDIYRPIIRKKASDKEIMWIGRLAVVLISVVAYFIAVNPNSGGIMDLVENAWAGFGAAFGPVIILSLYWKRFTNTGAIAGIIGGGLTVVLWIVFFKESTQIYELLPGFIVGLTCCVVGSLVSSKPSDDVVEIFEKAMSPDLDE